MDKEKQLYLKEQLTILRKSYAVELPDKISTIKNEWDKVQQHDDETVYQELIRMVHGLAGSGTTFGFATVSKVARQLETALHTYKQQNLSHQLSHNNLNTLLKELEQAAEEVPEVTIDTPLPLVKEQNIDNDTPVLALISDDPAFTKDLSNSLESFGISVHCFNSDENSLSSISQSNPYVILIGRTAKFSAVDVIQTIKQQKTPLLLNPAFFIISEHESIELRLNAVRAGAASYFLEPVNLEELVKSIRAQLPGKQEVPYRILIIDDDEPTAHYTALMLQRAGMDTQVVTNPLQVLEPMMTFQPELILLDMHMPECSGLELATIIRQQYAYTGTSIVFFTVETNIDCHIDALRAGGNMFFIKPMESKRLVAAVEAQAKHSRLIRSLMMYDGLTGLLNRVNFDACLKREISHCERSGDIFSYVILDLDHFKQVNDQYGHTTGDRVLRSLASIFTNRLRALDIVGRYGGEEFSLILPGTDAKQATQIMQELLTAFSQISHQSNKQSFSLTFSAGIACYPEFKQASAIQESADQALYQAKAAGRNQIKISGS